MDRIIEKIPVVKIKFQHSRCNKIKQIVSFVLKKFAQIVPAEKLASYDKDKNKHQFTLFNLCINKISFWRCFGIKHIQYRSWIKN